MKFIYEEMEQILDLSDDEKRQGIKELSEQGKFDDLKFPTRKECVIAIQLNDALFEDDPFYKSPFPDYRDIAYFAYFPIVETLMKGKRYKDVEKTYRYLEDVHQQIGLSTRSKIYDAMVCVQRILKLPPRKLVMFEID